MPKTLSTLFDDYPEPVLITAAEPFNGPDNPPILYCNAKFTEATGYQAIEVLGRSPKMLQYPGTDMAVVKALGERLRQWLPSTARIKNLRKDGSPFWSELHIWPVADPDGWYIYWISIQHDVSELVRQEAEISAQVEKLKEAYSNIEATLNSVRDVIIVINKRGLVTRTNAVIQEILGYESDELIGRNVSVLMPDDIARMHDTYIWHFLKSGTSAIIGKGRAMTARRKDGTIIPAFLTIEPIYGDSASTEPTHFVGVLHDQSREALYVDKIEKLAFYTKSGLQNVNHFIRILKDITVGHSGPDLMQLAAVRVRIANYNQKVLIFGRDNTEKLISKIYEFISVIMNVRTISAADEAGDLIVLLEHISDLGVEVDAFYRKVDAFIRSDLSLRYSVKIKISYVSLNGEFCDGESIIQATLAGFESSKLSPFQQPIVAYDDSVIDRIYAEDAMLMRLHEAVDADAFELFLQPRVQLATGRFHGAEALLRWMDDGTPIASPPDIIRLAHKSGLLNKLTKGLLRKLVDAKVALTAVGAQDLRVSFNYTIQDLLDRTLLDELRFTVEHAGLDKAGFEIEVTETGIFDRMDEIQTMLSAYRAEGFLVALDDFGSGYSSLSVLADLPVDVVKLDRSLLVSAERDVRRVGFLQGICDMIQGTNAGIVIEGIERLDAVRRLVLPTQAEGQGYLYGRPMPVAAFVSALIENRQPTVRTG